MKCLETRTRNGLRWRRYRTDDGRTVTTYEVPTSVLAGVTTTERVQARFAQWLRAEQARERAQLVKLRIAEGVKPEAIAHEVGMTARNVQRIRKKLNSESKQ